MPFDFDLIADTHVLLNDQRFSKMYFAFRKGNCMFGIIYFLDLVLEALSSSSPYTAQRYAQVRLSFPPLFPSTILSRSIKISSVFGLPSIFSPRDPIRGKGASYNFLRKETYSKQYIKVQRRYITERDFQK